MKPTTLGYVQLSELQQEIAALPNQGMCVKRRGINTCQQEHVSLEGMDCFGNWLTAPYKQYPPSMNDLIARAALRAWHRLQITSRIDIDDPAEHAASAFYVPLDPYHTEQVEGGKSESTQRG